MEEKVDIKKEDSDILKESCFLTACKGLKTDFTPIWLMRQAGRYMKEYRDLRAKVPFIDLCKNSDLACEVTVTAARKIGVDAAIIFSDILLILQPMGFQIEYDEGLGPRIHNPIQEPKDVDSLLDFNVMSELFYVFDAIKKVRSELDKTIPLIGFSGAPFTLASYLIEGGGSKNFLKTKRFMYKEKNAWDRLMENFVKPLSGYLSSQIDAGAQALQIFDSWVGCLSRSDYREYVMPHMKSLLNSIGGRVPIIHFGTGTSVFLEDMKEAGGDVIGLDFRVDLMDAWNRLGKVSVQGNLDPCVLLSDRKLIAKKAGEILQAVNMHPGHIFNLGHGVLPETPEDNVKFLVDFVHEWRVRN
ncbi:MAG: uroporphyrinogen decarboxylase [Nitrospinota bacterium]|nr:uroporphyrinogen decarboxylase [Nitrospinota bacterium]